MYAGVSFHYKERNEIKRSRIVRVDKPGPSRMIRGEVPHQWKQTVPQQWAVTVHGK